MSTLYSLTNDLLSPAQSLSVREEVLDFYCVVSNTQFEQLGLARVHLFGLVEWKSKDKDKVIISSASTDCWSRVDKSGVNNGCRF